MQRLFPTVAGHVEPTAIYDELDFRAVRDGRAWPAVNMVSTIDGKTTLDLIGVREPIGSVLHRTLMKRLRVHFDAVSRGAGPVRTDSFCAGVPAELEHRRIALGLAR